MSGVLFIWFLILIKIYGHNGGLFFYQKRQSNTALIHNTQEMGKFPHKDKYTGVNNNLLAIKGQGVLK